MRNEPLLWMQNSKLRLPGNRNCQRLPFGRRPQFTFNILQPFILGAEKAWKKVHFRLNLGWVLWKLQLSWCFCLITCFEFSCNSLSQGCYSWTWGLTNYRQVQFTSGHEGSDRPETWYLYASHCYAGLYIWVVVELFLRFAPTCFTDHTTFPCLLSAGSSIMQHHYDLYCSKKVVPCCTWSCVTYGTTEKTDSLAWHLWFPWICNI